MMIKNFTFIDLGNIHSLFINLSTLHWLGNNFLLQNEAALIKKKVANVFIFNIAYISLHF